MNRPLALPSPGLAIILVCWMSSCLFSQQHPSTTTCITSVDAWSPRTIQQRLTSSNQRTTTAVVSTKLQQSSSSSKVWAKRPPTSGFDLDAIEAFEQELLPQEQQQQDGVDIDDDDDILSTERNKNILVLTVPDHLGNKRIDAVIATILKDQVAVAPEQQVTKLSRSQCATLVTQSFVTVRTDSGTQELLDRKSFKVQKGQEIEINWSKTFLLQ
jgi:hypothetical protein